MIFFANLGLGLGFRRAPAMARSELRGTLTLGQAAHLRAQQRPACSPSGIYTIGKHQGTVGTRESKARRQGWVPATTQRRVPWQRR